MKLKPIETGLSGASIIDRLRRGHMVRRACWQDHVMIRICNEHGFDENGLAIFDDRRDNLYTICTDGYFLHLASSSQPFRDVRVFSTGRYTYEYSRDGEGIGMLFADDWEDYGFITKKDFDTLTHNLMDKIRTRHAKLVKDAKKKQDVSKEKK